MRYRKNIFRDKSFLAMAGISVLAIAAIAGGLMLNNGSTEEPETGYIADLNDSVVRDTYVNMDTGINNDNDDNKIAANNGAQSSTGTEPDTKADSDTPTVDNDKTVTDVNTLPVQEETTGGDSSEAGVGVFGFTFTADSTLVWPVETADVIIDYSPDSTIYFATLDKYKTSNAISIRSDVGTPVYAAAPGTISDIGYNEEIGNSISLDLGNDYTLQYGQIKDIQVDEGDVVSEGDLLCYVANPTKYYSVEGPNLYLKLTNAEGTVDPLDYLDYKDAD